MPYNEEIDARIRKVVSRWKNSDAKKMFGGVGLFHNGKMFGMLGGVTFRLKVDDTNRADYEAKGMQPHSSGSKKKGMPYWEVPAEVIEDKEQLKQWAEKAYQAAVRA